MPSDQGELKGDGWELLSDAVQAQILSGRASSKRTVRIDRLTTRVPQGFRSHLMKAARKRGLAVEAYQRRAIAAVLAYDMGLDWWELLADEPWVTTYAGGLDERKPLAGAGFGPWQIDGMSDPP